MTLIKKISMNTRLKDMELCVADAPKGRKALVFQHKNGERFIIEEFSGIAAYKRWLCEAALARCSISDEKTLDNVRKFHLRIFKFLEEKERRRDEIIH